VGHSGNKETDLAAALIERWQKSGAAERADFRPFLLGLGVSPPAQRHGL
jgi:hypothetical protein